MTPTKSFPILTVLSFLLCFWPYIVVVAVVLGPAEWQRGNADGLPGLILLITVVASALLGLILGILGLRKEGTVYPKMGRGGMAGTSIILSAFALAGMLLLSLPALLSQ